MVSTDNARFQAALLVEVPVFHSKGLCSKDLPTRKLGCITLWMLKLCGRAQVKCSEEIWAKYRPPIDGASSRGAWGEIWVFSRHLSAMSPCRFMVAIVDGYTAILALSSTNAMLVDKSSLVPSVMKCE
jgi:hypothetical protein